MNSPYFKDLNRVVTVTEQKITPTYSYMNKKQSIFYLTFR